MHAKNTMNIKTMHEQMNELGLSNGLTNIVAPFYNSALGQAAPNLGSIAKGRAAAANIMNMIASVSESSKRLDDGTVLPQVAGKIDFCEVCFAYPSRSNMIFENLSFSVNAGKTVAVVGPSGSGKSTIISLIQRFYEPSSGNYCQVLQLECR